MSKGISTQQQQILGAAVAISRIRNTLADRIRALAVQNDPDAIRAGLEEIAAALESE